MGILARLRLTKIRAMWSDVSTERACDAAEKNQKGTIRFKDQTDIHLVFLCVCPVTDQKFGHHIVKVAVDPRGDIRVDPQTTLTML